MNQYLPIVRVTEQQPPPAGVCSDLLCRAELPDHFEVIVTWRALALADTETWATAYDQWIAAKAELRKRGYDVWESFDDRRNAYIASCTKRHNRRALRRERKR